jgi:hypothetical protein
MIPDFNTEGNLPAGIHTCTWTDFTQHFAWNTHRAIMIGGLRAALISLHTCGCQTAWIDGSFTSNKTLPNDIDVCYDNTSTDLQYLRQLEPTLLDFSNARAKMKQKFSCECFPATLPASPDGLTFLEFFQIDRQQQAKGIIELNLNELEVKP